MPTGTTLLEIGETRGPSFRLIHVRRRSRRVKTRTKQILWLMPLAVAAAYAVALTGFRSEPSGYVASYSFLPHARTDVLDFSRGIVTLRTCCGDSPCGTYS